MSRVVYFIQDDGNAIKIGTTGNIRRRLDTMRTHSARALVVLGVADGGSELESSLHDMFSASRLNGEWFSPTPELLEWIGAFTKQPNLESKAGYEKITCRYTIKASEWLRRIIALRTEHSDVTVRAVIVAIAADLRIAPGILENLLRGRTSGVLASEYFALNELLMADLRKRLVENERLLEDVLARPFHDAARA